MLVDKDEGVFLGVSHNVLVRLPQLIQQQGRVLLDEKDIGFQSLETDHKLLELLFLVKETHLVERGDLVEKDGAVVLNNLFEGEIAEDPLQKCVVHDEVVKFHCFLLLVFPLKLERRLVLLELLLPLLLKLLPAQKGLPEYTD